MESSNWKTLNTTSSPIQENDSIIIPVGMDEDPETTVEDSKGSSKVPCVICFVPVTAEVADKSKIFEPLTQEEQEHDKVFQWFALNLWFHYTAKRKGQAKTKLERFDQLILYKSVGWDGEGGNSPPLPFCEGCKNEVIGLMEKKKRIQTMGKGRKEEKESLREGIRQVRRKMGRCESDYLNSGIYEKDKRYHRVRKFIINVNLAMEGKLGGYSKRKTQLEGMGKEVEAPAPAPQVEMRRTVLEVPCLICCATLKIFPDEKKTDARKDEDSRVFRWFLRNLQNPPGQLLFSFGKKVGEVSTEFWDGKLGRSEPLQFCGGCRNGVVEWMGIRRNVQNLKERTKEFKRMKERMRQCEDEFEKCGIYEKDPRYFNVRRKVIKVLETEALPEKPKPLKTKKGKMKKKEVKRRQLFQKGQMDEISGEGFVGLGAEQQVEFVVKTEEDQEMEVDWQWEDDDDEEEDELPIMHVKVEQDEGMELLGSGSGAMEIETEDHERVQVKEENVFEEDEDDLEMDPLGPDTDALEVEVEDDDLEDNHEPRHRNCLLCYKAISEDKSALAPALTNDLSEQNFNSMFVLRKMLNVPEERLLGYLEDFGCPGKWVEYCVTCLCLVDRALLIQKEINKLEDKLRGCQEKMVLKIQATCKQDNKAPETQPGEITRITEESRQFVISESASRTKKAEKPVGSPNPSDNSQERILNPISAKKAKLSLAEDDEDESLELTGNKDMKIVKILNGGKYSCSQCPTLTENMSLVQFYSHLIFHAKRPFRCSICNVYWSSPKELEKNSFVKDNPLNDEHVCSEATLVKIPDGKFNPGKIWSCKLCPRKFDIETERDLHEDQEHSSLKNQLELKYNCLSCSHAYRCYQEWLLHQALEHPKVAATSCLFCDFSAVIPTKEEIGILDPVKMRRHVNTQHPSCGSYFTFPETCDFCGLTIEFGKFGDFFAHIKNVHKGLRPYHCEICWKSFAVKKYLYCHMSLSHGN